jgi:protein-S-isoprenylcysteine O-methyltransferase Ste14
MRRFLERGGLWVLGQFALMAAVIVSGWVWRQQWTSRLTLVLAVALFAAAATVGLWGAIVLGRNLTPFPKPDRHAVLVQHGIYGVVRHPLYASVLLAALGWALAWASGPALALALVLSLFFKAKAEREERWLRERFPEYADYARRVPQLIPWIY